MVERLFIGMPRGCLRLVIVVFSDHTHYFWWKFYQELTETMVQVPEGWQCKLNVNIMSNRKKVMLTKDAPLSSHLADYVL